MPSAIDAILAAVFSIIIFLGASCLGLFLISRKSPCEGCEHYVKDGNECWFNPLASDGPPPKQCPREAWDI